MIKKILLFSVILLFTMGFVCGALTSDFKAPNGFEHSSYLDENDSINIYCFKGDEDKLFLIEKYDDEYYGDLFKNNTEYYYSVTSLGNNTYMGLENGIIQSGAVMEVIEHNGEKYLVYTFLKDTSDKGQIKDSANYLTEFNKLNNVEPIAI